MNVSLTYLEKPVSLLLDFFQPFTFLQLTLQFLLSTIKDKDTDSPTTLLIPSYYPPIQHHFTGLYGVHQRPKQAPFFLKTFAVTCSLHSECPILPLLKFLANYHLIKKAFPNPYIPCPPFLYLALFCLQHFDQEKLVKYAQCVPVYKCVCICICKHVC